MEKKIEEADFAGFVELYFNGLCSGWTGIEDAYGPRLVPMIREDVWDWLEKDVVGTYVLEGGGGDSSRKLTHSDDRIYFEHVHDLLMFKLRWIG